MNQPQKKRRPRRTYTVRDVFVLYGNERTILHEIFKENVLKYRRCTQLSLSDLANVTGLSRSSISYALKRLKKKRMIDIEKTQKTQTICFNMVYREILGKAVP